MAGTSRSSGSPSNPDLAENGSVQIHAGIAGVAGLNADHGWNGPVLSITIERTS